MKTSKCALCGSKKIDRIIDLGNHPLADSFLNTDQVAQPIKYYPLNVMICDECGHAMLGFIVPAEERYQKIDYSYTASNSKISRDHFEEMARTLSKKFNIGKADKVIDIGSNDGTLLQYFRQIAGCEVLGFEPSKNISTIAIRNEINTTCDFFNLKSASKYVREGRAKLITATNVFNHINDYHDFVKGIKKILTKDGIFVFEVPYFLELIRRGAFDTVYLEHTSYFTVRAFDRFFKKYGMTIVGLEVNDYMGGSIRVEVQNGNYKENIVKKFIAEEIKYGLYKKSIYIRFVKRIEDFKNRLLADLIKAKNKNDGRIVAIGAATKGNTLLNYCKIDNSLVDFVTDSSPLKVGKFMPGSNIPIYSDSEIDATVKYALVLPWNIATFLKGKFKGKKIKFIIPEFK